MNVNWSAEVPRAAEGQHKVKGTWQRLLHHTPEPEYKPYWTAIVWCPECGRGLLASLHKIEDNGVIVPSLGHPDSYPPCGWHHNVKLLGWNPQEWVLPGTPPLCTCEKCSKQSHTIGGWGTWSGGPGIICEECFKARQVEFGKLAL